MQGTQFSPAPGWHAFKAAHPKHKAHLTQHRFSGGLGDHFKLTARKPGETVSQLEKRAETAKLSKATYFTTFAEKQDDKLVLPDYSLKPNRFMSAFKKAAPKPANLSDVKPGQTIINQRSQQVIKVKTVSPIEATDRYRRKVVKGAVVKASDGQITLQPTEVRSGFMFQFVGTPVK